MILFISLQSWTTVCPILAVMAVLAMRKEWITRAHAVGTGSDSAVPIVCDLNLNVFQFLQFLPYKKLAISAHKTCACFGLINIIFLNILYKYSIPIFFNHMNIYISSTNLPLNWLKTSYQPRKKVVWFIHM